MGGSHSESLFRQQLPTKLPKVEAWPIHLAEPEPRGVEETLYERFGYNDIDEVFQPTTTYSRWVQPSQDELAKQVEYDMNDVDKAWLDRVNSERRKDGLDGISYEFFEILMDKLEKEWFDLSKHFPKPASNLTVDDSKCTICDDGECEASNAIVFCDGCNLAVHQDCYGVPYIPEGQWLCRKCTVSPDRDVSCMLCPGHHGAFKQTVNGQWAHLLCAIWINETWVSNTVYMEPIDGIESIPKQRWRLICNLCKKRSGACIQCSKGSCYTAYHVTCAREHGLYLKLGTNSGATTTDGSGGTNISYCDKHSRQAFGEEEDEERAVSEELKESRPKKRKLISHGEIDRAPSQEADRKGKKVRKSLSHGIDDSYASRNTSLAPVSPPKKKKKRRIKQEIPVIPRYVYDKVWNYIKPLRCQKKQTFVRMVCRYWSLKRSRRQGAPLLKRLHLEPWTASAGATRDATDLEREQRLELILRLRNDLEKVRNMVELVRKRENEKLRRAQLFKQVIDGVIFPQTGLFRATLREIQKLDGRQLFYKPVSKTDVPDYHVIVKSPMDWQTMYEKLDQNAYVTAGDFQADVKLVIHNALIYNTVDSLHGKAALKLRSAVAPLLAKLEEFDDPNSEIRQKHRRYLDAIDDSYIDALMSIDYPAPEDLPAALATTAPLEVPVNVDSDTTSQLPRAGIPEILSSASSVLQAVQSLGKRKRSEDNLDAAPGFRAPNLFSSSFGFYDNNAPQAGPSGTSGESEKERKKSARALALEKKRQQNREYRARVRAKKLAEKAQQDREAIIAAGGDPDAIQEFIAPSIVNHASAPNSLPEPSAFMGPIDQDALSGIPSESDANPLYASAEPTGQDTSNDQGAAAWESEPMLSVPKAEIEESAGIASPSLSAAVPSGSDSLGPGDREAPLAPDLLVHDSLETPRLNEWGAAIDRVEPPTDYEANLLFNDGWILPAGSKRRRASSANTETSGPILKGRKASLPAPSVSPMFPPLNLPASAPSNSIALPPLPPLPEQSSSPDLPDGPSTEQPAQALPASSELNQPAHVVSQQEVGVKAEDPVSAPSPPAGASQQHAEEESELSDIDESREASQIATDTATTSPAHADNTAPPRDIAKTATDVRPPSPLSPGLSSLSEHPPTDSADAPLAPLLEVTREVAPESELSDLDNDIDTPKTPKSASKPASHKNSTRKSRSSSAKAKPSEAKPVSRPISSRSRSPGKTSSNKKKGTAAKKTTQDDAHLADAESDEEDAKDAAPAAEASPHAADIRTRDAKKPEGVNGIADNHKQAASLTPDPSHLQARRSPSKTRQSPRDSPGTDHTVARARGRKKKGKRVPNSITPGQLVVGMRSDKPSRTISQKRLKEAFHDKPSSFVIERLGYLIPHVRYNSFEEVKDYDLVWARSSKQAPYWPGEICLDVEERDGDVPQLVLDAHPNKHANRQASEDAAGLDDRDISVSLSSKKPESSFEHYVLVQWFPQGSKSTWSWIPFDPDYLTRLGESKEYDAIMQNRFPTLFKKKKKNYDDVKRIRAAYEDCFTNMETPPPSDSEEELQDFSKD